MIFTYALFIPNTWQRAAVRDWRDGRSRRSSALCIAAITCRQRRRG